MHVLRKVHRALRPGGLLLDVHPLGLEFAVRAGRRGLGFVDTRKFTAMLEAMNAGVDQTMSEGLFEQPVSSGIPNIIASANQMLGFTAIVSYEQWTTRRPSYEFRPAVD